MRLAVTAARVLAGLPLLVFGLNIFFGFLPLPEPDGPAGEFYGALAAAGYLMPLVGAVEVATGALLLANVLVPLALVLVTPVLVNALLYHAFLAPEGIAPAAVLLALVLFLAWAYRAHFAPLFAPRARPLAAERA